MSAFRQTYSNSRSGNRGDVYMVESGQKTGLYYITFAGLRRGTTWQRLKDWIQHHVGEPDYIEIHALGGWVRVTSYEKFRETFEFMNGTAFNGHIVIASDNNETYAIPIKCPSGPPPPPRRIVPRAPRYSILPPAQTSNGIGTGTSASTYAYAYAAPQIFMDYSQETYYMSPVPVSECGGQSFGTGTSDSIYVFAAPQIFLDYGGQETHDMYPVPVSESGGQSFEAPGQGESYGSVAMSRSVASPGSAFTPRGPDPRPRGTTWSTDGGDDDSEPASGSGEQSVSGGSTAPSSPLLSEAEGPIIADGSTRRHRSNSM